MQLRYAYLNKFYGTHPGSNYHNNSTSVVMVQAPLTQRPSLYIKNKVKCVVEKFIPKVYYK